MEKSKQLKIDEFRKIVLLMNLRDFEDMKEHDPDRFYMLKTFVLYQIED